MSTVLATKLRRDIWRQRWQFLAAALVIAIGVAVYVAASDAYRNLQQSFDRAYAEQLLPDAVLSGPGAPGLRTAAAHLPGDPLVAVRQQGDVTLRIGDHALLGRAVGIPAGEQPAVARLALRAGGLPARGEAVIEQHLADYYDLRPGDTIEVLSVAGWRAVRVSGTALSTEYFWPARSNQEILTSPEYFGVLFAPQADLPSLLAEPEDQLLLYARDRAAAAQLAAAAETLARAEGLLFTSREEQPSYKALAEDVEGIGTFARLLPWLFLAAAALGTYVLLSRLVSAQRAVIGTLAANGLSGRALRRHYLGYGVAAGLGGALPGLVAGYFLGVWFTTMYTAALGLPLHVTSVHPASLAIGAFVGTAAAALAAWVPARAAAHTSPAEAMRLSPPGIRGGVSGAERILPPLRRLPARWRMTLRGVTRNRRRAILTVLGVAAAVSLVLVFAGLRDSISLMFARQYDDVQREDAEVHVVPGAAAAVLAAARRDPGVALAEPFARLDITLQRGDRQYQTLLVALAPDTRLHGFTSDGRQTQLPADGILLGEGARRLLGIGEGETLTLTVVQTGRQSEQRVAGFVDEAMNPVAYVSMGHLAQIAGSAQPSGVLLQLAPSASEQDVRTRITALPGVAAYISTAAVAAAMRQAFSLYDALVGVMLVFAALMAIALLYNAMSANVAERSVELGTLRAAGMDARLLGRLVAAENLLLVVLGLPLGIGAGVLIADWFMSLYETEGYQWHLTLSVVTPLMVIGAVVLAALLAQLPSLRAIGRMDVARIVRERSL